MNSKYSRLRDYLSSKSASDRRSASVSLKSKPSLLIPFRSPLISTVNGGEISLTSQTDRRRKPGLRPATLSFRFKGSRILPMFASSGSDHRSTLTSRPPTPFRTATCSSHRLGSGFINCLSMTSEPCRPSRIMVTMLGARRLRRRIRQA